MRWRLRRQHVDEQPVLAIAAIVGLAGLLAGLQPTGVAGWDQVLVVVSFAFVVWAGASAPWWALSAAAGVAAAAAMSPVVFATAALGFMAALSIGIARRGLSIVRALISGVTVLSLAFADIDAFQGVGALFGAVAAIVLIAAGLPRRRRRSRRIGYGMIAGTAAVTAVAVIGAMYAVGASRQNLDAALTASRTAARLIERGEYDDGAAELRRSADLLRRSDSSLSRPWAYPSRLVPVVAQNVSAVSNVVDDGEVLIGTLAATVAEVDPAQVTLRGGRVDLEAVRTIADNLAMVERAIDDLGGTIGSVESGWLVEPVRRRLDRAIGDLDENREQLEQLTDLADAAPRLLGGEGVRRYLLLFTQPSEARGLGGFAGNFGELVVDDGAIRLEQFGRMADLERVVGTQGATCAACPDDFIRRWGLYGFARPDGSVGERAWSNITISPHFPSVAEVAAVLYPQSGGTSIDGVIAVDPYVMQQLIEYTGAIRLADGTRLGRNNAAEFLVRGQYDIVDRDERIDVLAEAAELTMSAMLGADLPDPLALIDDLRPLVDEKRLLFWPIDPADQALVEGRALAGGLPDAPTLGVFINNAAGNKIDMYLRREVSTESALDGDGVPSTTARIELTNAVPDGRQPNIVVGNSVGRPIGTNRMILSIYGPDALESLTIDGVPLESSVSEEQGWVTHSIVFDIARGATRVVEVSFRGEVDTDEVVLQPLVRN